MKTVLEQLLGTTDVTTYFAWFLLAFIGAFTAIVIRAKFKYKYSDDTPYRWSWSFLLRDNLINLIVSFFISLIFFRFTNQVLKIEPNFLLAILFGGTSNELALQFIKYNLEARK
ncbi:hypothetical protein OIU80_05590 [Flavobacterium sp. LS1R47]|uniref:Uncharacterized protein n=1 Tax=Flavobacterium frigoritolerans TaxID=2987686 RepID=A0A9X2ZIK2_9FLAO|nr:hypothetical protein [Flavobacterium frigoritolerans]MCV9931749.1 hypothetical protein [Flavobacterium frigoritolerans]